MNINQMMKQAQQMQERLQKQMAEMRVEASAGGGMVTVVVNGNKQIQSLKIDPEVVSKEDVEMLQDLILAAINDAQPQGRRAAEQADERPDGRHEDTRMGSIRIECRIPNPSRASSINSSGFRASARRARSGWRFTFCARRATRPIG